MIKFLQGLLGKKSSSGSADASSDTEALLKSEPPSVQWLSKDDPKNPFVVDGYDCLAFVRSMLSSTQDPGVAASFTELRGSLGQEHVGRFPSDSVALDCRLAYPFDGETSEGVLFKAARMEEKWDIYLYGDRLYFSRSWTGGLAFVAQFGVAGGSLTISQISASSSGTGMDYRYAVRQVDYLVRSHILKESLPHPLPTGLDRDPASVGLFSFSQYGWLCCFGTFDETLRRDLAKVQADLPT